MAASIARFSLCVVSNSFFSSVDSWHNSSLFGDVAVVSGAGEVGGVVIITIGDVDGIAFGEVGD